MNSLLCINNADMCRTRKGTTYLRIRQTCCNFAQPTNDK